MGTIFSATRLSGRLNSGHLWIGVGMVGNSYNVGKWKKWPIFLPFYLKILSYTICTKIMGFI